MILIVIIVLSILTISSVAGYKYYESNKACPTGTSETNKGGAANDKCKCPEGKVYVNGQCQECGTTSVYKDGKCNECVGGSVSNIKSLVKANIDGCYCPEGKVFENGQCVECGNNATFINGACVKCPDGSATNNTGISTNVGACKCTNNGIFKDGKCILCDGKSIPGGQGGVATPDGCFCPENQTFSNGVCRACLINEVYSNGLCIACPTNATNVSASGITTDVDKCYCPSGSFFDAVNKICITCSGISTGNGLGGAAAPKGCYCPYGMVVDANGACQNCGENQVFNKDTRTCNTCPSGADPVDNGGIETKTVKGCYCPPGTVSVINSKGVESCVPCAAGSSTKYLGASAYPAGCFCPDNQVYNQSTAKCENCSSDTYFENGECKFCKLGSSTTASKYPAYDNVCFCPGGGNDYIFDPVGGCIECKGGSSLSGVGGTANHSKCKCPNNMIYNAGTNLCVTCGSTGVYDPINKVCLQCLGNSASSYTGDKANVDGCFCKTGEVWATKTGNTSPECLICPEGSSTYPITNSKTNIDKCFCKDGYEFSVSLNKCVPCSVPTQYYDTVTGKCITCPTGSSTTNIGPVTTDPKCNCPDQKIYNTTSKSCESCNIPYQYYLNGSCIACPVGTATDGTGQPSTSDPKCICPSNYTYNTDGSGCTPIGNTGIFNTATKTVTYCVGGSTTDGKGGSTNVEGCYCPDQQVFINNTTCAPCDSNAYYSSSAKSCIYCAPIVVNNMFTNGNLGWTDGGETGIIDVFNPSVANANAVVFSLIPAQVKCKFLNRSSWTEQYVREFTLGHKYAIFVRLNYPPSNYAPSARIQVFDYNRNELTMASTFVGPERFIPAAGVMPAGRNVSDFTIVANSLVSITDSNVPPGYFIRITNVSSAAASLPSYLLVLSVHVVDITPTVSGAVNPCKYPFIVNPIFELDATPADFVIGNVTGWKAYNANLPGLVKDNAASFNNLLLNPLCVNFRSSGVYNCPITQYNNKFMYLQRADVINTPVTAVSQVINNLVISKRYMLYITAADSVKNPGGLFAVNIDNTNLQPLSPLSGFFMTYVYSFTATGGSMTLTLANGSNVLYSSVLIAGVYISLIT